MCRYTDREKQLFRQMTIPYMTTEVAKREWHHALHKVRFATITLSYPFCATITLKVWSYPFCDRVCAFGVNCMQCVRFSQSLVIFSVEQLYTPLLQRSERPLQDHVQTTTHAKEHHSFRTFSTPTPHRASQVQQNDLFIA